MQPSGMDTKSNHQQDEFCWIHIKDVYTFLHLGANPHEQRVGQNVRIDLSVQIPFLNTKDDLSKTTDYGSLVQRVKEYIEKLGQICLLEYLAELILNLISDEFPSVYAARLTIYKGYVPLPHFTGSVAIECQRRFRSTTLTPP